MTPPMATDEQPKQRRRGNLFATPRPMCPQHGDTMFANGTKNRWTNYYCSVDDCKHSRKRPHSKHGTNGAQNGQ